MLDLSTMLRQCPALAALPARRLHPAARASQEETYRAGEIIPATPERLYISQEGRIALHIWLCPGTRCGGTATVIIRGPGHLFGWSSVAKEEQLQVQAVCQEPVRVIAIDLARLKESETGLRLREAAVGCLYALLEDAGLCPRSGADRVVLGAEDCSWTDAEILELRKGREA